jgi:hypothetical protein
MTSCGPLCVFYAAAAKNRQYGLIIPEDHFSFLSFFFERLNDNMNFLDIDSRDLAIALRLIAVSEVLVALALVFIGIYNLNRLF